jgi:hypothetical protein
METSRPWWADDPEIAAARRQERGLSWGEIGRVLGVSKQVLHRRFGGAQ